MDQVDIYLIKRFILHKRNFYYSHLEESLPEIFVFTNHGICLFMCCCGFEPMISVDISCCCVDRLINWSESECSSIRNCLKVNSMEVSKICYFLLLCASSWREVCLQNTHFTTLTTWPLQEQGDLCNYFLSSQTKKKKMRRGLKEAPPFVLLINSFILFHVSLVTLYPFYYSQTLSCTHKSEHATNFFDLLHW